jgi:hypothetical protein
MAYTRPLLAVKGPDIVIYALCPAFQQGFVREIGSSGNYGHRAYETAERRGYAFCISGIGDGGQMMDIHRAGY